MGLVIPHSFQDNVDEVASGVQVDENFDVLRVASDEQEAATTALAAKVAGLITAAGVSGLRAQAGSLAAPAYGGGRLGLDISLPFAWPAEHLLVLAQMHDSGSHIAYGPCSGHVLGLGSFHFDSESGANPATISWVSLGR